MTTMPKFDFSQMDVTDEEVQKASEKSSPKFFFPGNYDLKIKSATIGKQNVNDPTWFSVQLTLGGIDEREIRTFLMVPTKTAKFNKPGLKNPLFLYIKFVAFMAGIGQQISVKTLKTVVPKVLGDLNNLIGKAVNVDIGYDGYYIGRTADKTFTIMEKSGKVLKESGEYADRDGAIADAAELGINIKSFPEVLKFNPTEAQPEEDSDTPGW